MLNTEKIIEDTLSAVKKAKPKRVLLQAPEGLKTKVKDIASAIEKEGPECVIYADPTYGACDIPENTAKMLNCDLIIHIGHTDMVGKTTPKTEYIEYFADTDILTPLKKHAEKLKGIKTINVATTIQLVKKLTGIKEFLETEGHKVVIGKSKNLSYAGQVLGCDPTAATGEKADAILYIGSGTFHPLGISRYTSTPIYVLDIDKNQLYDLKEERRLYEKKTILKAIKYNDSKTVGILVSTKKDQFNKNIFKIKKQIESEGKKADILVMDNIAPDKIIGMQFDILINTACPRIEDDLVYDSPVVNWTTILHSK